MIFFVALVALSLGTLFGVALEKHIASEHRRKQYRVPVRFGDYTPPDVPRRRPF
jgi:hypothetical protein